MFRTTLHRLVLLPFMLFFLSALPLFASGVKSGLTGAWEYTTTVDGAEVTQWLMITDGFFTWTEFKSSDGDFMLTKGGSWETKGKELFLNYEFHTTKPDEVGQQETLAFKLEKGDDLRIEMSNGETYSWTKIDAVSDSPLNSAWLFSGRKRNGEGEIQRRSTEQPRKTMKMLTGNHFQWIAYNTETKEFFGTGGGTYTATNGTYIETIVFFSRDKNRVGAELTFDFDVQKDEWHHSGFSSKGDPMYEVWTRRD